MEARISHRGCACWLVSVLVFLLLACSGSGDGDGNQVLWFSDLHFSPFVDPAIVPALAGHDHTAWDGVFSASDVHARYPAAGQESNHKLLKSALQEMRRRVPHPDLILFTGDFLAHDFIEHYAAMTGDADAEGARRFIDKTLAYLASEISNAYPRTPVFFCLGNNDSYEGDYLITPGSPFLAASAGILAQFLKTETDQAALAATYPQAGSYVAVFPGQDSARVLALNAVYFSRNAPGSSDAAARGQLNWLEERLADAARTGQRVWIILHIPPGVDVFATRRANPAGAPLRNIVPLMKETHLAWLRNVLTRHQDSIAAIFAGHIHRDDFRLALSESGPGAVTFVVPAISPVYANNPGYKVLNYDPATLTIQDYEARYLDPADNTWKAGHVFSRAYGPGELSAARMGQLHADLLTQPAMRASYATAYAAFRTPAEITEDTFPAYWAAGTELDSASYRRAMQARLARREAKPRIWFSASLPPFWMQAKQSAIGQH